MSQYTEAPTRMFTAGAALERHRRVILSAGKLAYAGTGDIELGTTEREAFADGDVIPVRLRNAQGTAKMVASVAITAGNTAYGATNGRVAATGTVFVGTALEAATTDGDVIEVLRIGATDMTTDSGTNNASFTVDADSTAAKIALNTNSATGNYTNTIVTPNLAGDATITLPAVTGTLATLAGTETFTNKTLTSPTLTTPTANGITINNTLALEPASASGAGTNQGNATALSGAILYYVSGADGTVGVALPSAAAGLVVGVYNLHASNGLKIYPASGDDINDGTTDAAITIEGKTLALFMALDTTTWAAIYTTNT